MADEKKRQIDQALDSAGLQKGRIVIGTYDTGYRTRIGVYFHYNFSEKLANALIQLALQDKTVHEGIRELRENFDLILTAVGSAKPLKGKKGDKPVH
jgi:hypothetical protein